MDKELQKAIDLGNKRFAIINVVWTALWAIPLFIVYDLLPIAILQTYGFLLITVYMIIVIIGVAISPKIYNKIWKN